MSDSLPPIILNAHQRRHFEVLFARLEDSLTHVEALLEVADAPREVLAREELDVPAEFRELSAPVIEALRVQIRELAAALELRPRHLSRARAIAATLSAEAIRLEDSLSPRLRGYGEVDPSVPRHLDPALQAMARALGALAASLAHHSPPSHKR